MRSDSGWLFISGAKTGAVVCPFGDFYAEMSLRFGLNDAEFYYGDFSPGIQLGYLMGG